jgi:chromosome segregation protein
VKLKSLRLFGFKTFAEHTTLRFELGVTGIVGPNGSGKSNLVDAIRWVLGEQSSRSLRAGKNEDVIFAGNERRKPLGMAEVVITFDNEQGRLRVDAAEVQLTRRAYRGGESEFYINREQVRLRDVVELLMGTGLGPGSYAIVSQGQIDAILSSKPTERRSLFEETAGINRFLVRKNESLRRLEQTEQNAIRIHDVLTEITARIPELETQARRARRFRRASARLRDLEVLSYLRASASRREERERLQAGLQRFDVQRAGAGGKAAALDADLSTLRARLYAHDRNLEEARTAAAAARAQAAERASKHAAATARRETLEKQASQITADRERVVAECAEVEAIAVRLEAELTPMTHAVIGLREREQEAHESTLAARAALDRVFMAAASDAERRAQTQALQRDLERVERETRDLHSGAREKNGMVAAHARDGEQAALRARDFDAQLAIASETAACAQKRAEQMQRRLIEVQAELRAGSNEIAGLEARLHTIEELEANLEGHVPGTRAVLEADARGELAGIHGVVSNLIRVDETHARALDIAFGGALSNIVITTLEDAELAIKYLSVRELGRATFLPLDTLGSRTGRNDAPREPGVIGYAHTLVATQTEYAGIVAFLVGRILVVESLNVGVRLVRGRGFADTVVTLEGDEIRGGGAMTGGKSRRERSILSRAAQARSLREKLPRLREMLAGLEAEAMALIEGDAITARERDDARRRIAETANALREERARVEMLERERARYEREAQTMSERAREREIELALLRVRLPALEEPVVDTALTAARATVVIAEEAERAIAAEVAAVREAIASLTAQRDGARAHVASLSTDHERAQHVREAMRVELVALSEHTTLEERIVTDMRARVAEAEAMVERARSERECMTVRASALDAELRTAQLAEREASQACDKARLRFAEVEAELGMLAAQFAQNPATTDECAEIETRCAEETGDFTKEIKCLREDIVRLRDVNLNAEAEIEESAQREKFLKEQLDDLARAKETLIDGIAAIEQQSHEQFNAMFEKVRVAFAAAYVRMFPGGEAKMWQTPGEQLSEVGIEISVQPPGKKMMGLTSLSGGERAMTSAALIFALIAVKPSPFYLLDEVDAALDDVNVVRFSQTVRETAQDAQMLIVTHNKQTMELLDRMYGVTMAEPGISSIITANLSSPEFSQEQEEEERVVPA